MLMETNLSSYIDQQTKAAPLAVFRALFGLLMLVSMIRFWANGWIEKLYIEPSFHFSYFGFEWVKPLGNFTYLLFVLCAFSAIAITLGYRYKWAIVIFFLSFTYIELMDKTTYLNHYYFISVLSFLMIFLPASNYFSIDIRRNGSKREVPKWTIDSIKLLLIIIYFYAGLAKLNSDWLVEAMPLKIWLPSNYDLPLLGSLLQKEWVIYAFSWGGAAYDLAIPFLLICKPTRTIAFLLVVIFHILTGILFPIGMFPYVMIISALIFFDADFHEQLIKRIENILLVISRAARNIFPKKGGFKTERFLPKVEMTKRKGEVETPKWKVRIVMAFFVIQLLLPLRYMFYSDELFWTEEGYRFSWRVMLMEKAGYANFKVVNPETGKQFYVNNSDFLTSFQEKQMATQPDFILEYAHYLAKRFSEKNSQIEVYVESYVALNGRRSKPFIDPSVNLAALKESFEKKRWILPFGDEIKGI